MYFRNLTRRAEIGSNSYLLSLGASRILIDAGLHPRDTGFEALPALESIEPGRLDAVLLSHAHLDHAGALPVVLRQQPGARCYATAATRDLAAAMLHNSVNVMQSQREQLGVAEYPLFHHGEVNRFERNCEIRPVGKPFPVGKAGDEITCEFFHAGHVLGAVVILLRYRGRTIFYTGDVHFEDQSLAQAADFPEHPLDTIISESTRGAEDRPPGYTRAGEIAALGAAIRRTVDRGGAVLIPVFATGKTQETLLVLNELRESGTIPGGPIFIGGLSARMTEIYDRHSHAPHRRHRGFQMIDQMRLTSASRPRQRRRREDRNRRPDIPYLPGSIYLLSSGMMTENTLSNRFARRILPSHRDAIFIVGYASPDSPAGRLLETRPGGSVVLESGSPPVERFCDVEKFDFSGHATREAMCRFLARANPSRVFLVHGDAEATTRLSRALHGELPSACISVPAPGENIAIGGPPVALPGA